jgi:glutamate-1-semialdehyde 2,1-aminomutase
MGHRTPPDREAYLRRAERVIPHGASAGGRPLFREVISRARGAYLWNTHGKQYIDHLLAYGPIVLGHAEAHVNDAVKRTIDQVDLNWVGPQAGEIELAERIVRLVPSAEKVVLVNTGTDALQHALHVARAATGRRRILKFHGHYHGWAGELGTGANFDVEPGRAPAPDAPNSGGAIPDTAADVLVVDWNDAAAVRAAFAAVGSEIAAVFTEPYLHSYTNAAPAPGFLELLRELTTQSGALLVFDEVKTGFRHDLGGYQSIAGVTPDLTALGKALGNGYTIAALAGRADLMDLLGATVTVDGTYYANPYATAAALATLDQLEAGGVDRLWTSGSGSATASRRPSPTVDPRQRHRNRIRLDHQLASRAARHVPGGRGRRLRPGRGISRRDARRRHRPPALRHHRRPHLRRVHRPGHRRHGRGGAVRAGRRPLSTDRNADMTTTTHTYVPERTAPAPGPRAPRFAFPVIDRVIGAQATRVLGVDSQTPTVVRLRLERPMGYQSKPASTPCSG